LRTVLDTLHFAELIDEQKHESDRIRYFGTGEICQVNLKGNFQVSKQAVQTLCAAEVPIS